MAFAFMVTLGALLAVLLVITGVVAAFSFTFMCIVSFIETRNMRSDRTYFQKVCTCCYQVCNIGLGTCMLVMAFYSDLWFAFKDWLWPDRYED